MTDPLSLTGNVREDRKICLAVVVAVLNTMQSRCWMDAGCISALSDTRRESQNAKPHSLVVRLPFRAMLL